MANTQLQHRYVHGLDGLRALAVIFVFAYHYGFSWASGGFLGVSIFFVLSGYLITSILLKQYDEHQKLLLPSFFKSRIRRLFPAAFFMVVCVVAWTVLFKPSLLSTLQGDAIAGLLYISNWWFIFQDVSYFDSFQSPSPIKNLWSLAIEEQFYIIWPLLLLIGLRFTRKKKTVLFIISCGALVSALLMGALYEPGMDPSRVYYGTDTRSFELLIGCCLAFVWPLYRLSSKNVPSTGKFILNVAGLTSLLLVFLCTSLLNEFAPSMYRGGMFLVSLNAAVLVATISHPSSIIGKLLSFKPLRWIGTRSYGIYLWHYPIITLTTPTTEFGEFNYVHISLQVIATCFIAEISYRFIEQPIRKEGFKTFFRQTLPTFKPSATFRSHLKFAAPIVFVIFFLLFTLGVTGILEPKKTESKQPEAVHIETTAKPISQDNNLKEKESSAKEPSYTQVLSIGDSVMLNLADPLQETYPNIVIDGKVGRQLSEALNVAKNYAQFNEPSSAVIIQLGTNGYFTEEQLDELLKQFSKADVYLINARVPRQWETEVNEKLEKAAKESKNVMLVDWHTLGANHPEYFTKDGVHLLPEGAEQLTKLIYKAMLKSTDIS
ncbi:acyltransferase family protein [Priestia flexa]|uniref:acyltransferase family protein n=1 Tax=Priestia flexa TaxID=86664 RepID=UPI0009549B21|nr:acyltransferase family protein [Priestia flexa]MBY6087190.1 acetyltransferase [Priestia flexa]SIQ56316.1 peptidoglycan-N-acetylmuramate O-acetyltransferase [Priestia flexa]